MAVKIFMFVLLVCSFPLGQSKECLKSELSYANIKTTNLKESYEEGTTIRLTCTTGYIGSFRITCEQGSWNFKEGQQCRKKPCGHPGDAPYGDFKLMGEKEFVFGSTVEYTCRPGYIMATRNNRRNCRAEGWDNTVPICEVVKCPQITTSEDVIANGNVDDASFDDVIHFECTSHRKMLDGTDTIHCTKDGTWSAPLPNCIDIRCSPPQIAHGSITNPQEVYEENQLIKYTCAKHYKPTQGNPRCTKNGWSIMPECEEITCMLGFATPGVLSISPRGKNLFKPGEQLSITCLEKYWIFGTKKTTEIITCKDNGEWERPPTCNEIFCDVPNDEYLYYYDFYGDRKLGDTKTYQCMGNYQKAAHKAVCTINGWEPNPLCIEKACPRPQIEHARIVREEDTYAIGTSAEIQCLPGYKPERPFTIYCNYQQRWQYLQRCTSAAGSCGVIPLTNGFVYYFEDADRSQRASCSCNRGYKAFDEHWWEVITCQQGGWSSKPQCIREDECGSLPSIKNGKQIEINKTYKDGQSLEIECDFGYKSRPSNIKCLKGRWEKSVCERAKCDTPPEVENAVITSYTQDEDGEQSVTFKCQPGFEIQDDNTILCINSRWMQKQTCKSLKCPSPDQEINNGVLMTSDHDNKEYLEGDKVKYKCNDGFQFLGESIANCTQRTWLYPDCIESQPIINEQINSTSVTNETIQHGDKLLDQENSTVTCNGQDGTDSKCEEEARGCGHPPSIPYKGFKDRYEEGESVNYTCPHMHKRPSGFYLTCTRGKWIGDVICMKPCMVEPTEMDERNIQLNTARSRSPYVQHMDFIMFKCRKGKRTSGSVTFHQQCKDGTILLPVCKSG